MADDDRARVPGEQEDEPEWVFWPKGDGTSVPVTPAKYRELQQREREGGPRRNRAVRNRDWWIGR